MHQALRALTIALCVAGAPAWAATNPNARATEARPDLEAAKVAHERARALETGSPGMVPDLAASARLYQRAAGLGYPPAQYRLAQMYSSGRGVRKDRHLALAWLRRAAESQFAEAQYRLAAISEQGAYGVAPDPAASLAWLRRSAERNFAEAQYALGMRYAEGRDVARDALKALEWIVRAAGNGHREALAALRRASGRLRAPD
jgi:TPR repeat protein